MRIHLQSSWFSRVISLSPFTHQRHSRGITVYSNPMLIRAIALLMLWEREKSPSMPFLNSWKLLPWQAPSTMRKFMPGTSTTSILRVLAR